MKKSKKKQVLTDSVLIRITLVISVFTLLLSSYTFYSHVESVSHEESLWNGVSAVNERSSENRRAIARLMACQNDPASCSEIDWSRPYHTMRDVSEEFRHLE